MYEKRRLDYVDQLMERGYMQAEIGDEITRLGSVRDDYVDTVPELENLDLDPSDGNKSTGYDPYHND